MCTSELAIRFFFLIFFYRRGICSIKTLNISNHQFILKKKNVKPNGKFGEFKRFKTVETPDYLSL